jgi:glutathione S-transferase
MGPETLRLYGSPGSCSQVTLIALEETGAEYRSQLVLLRRGDQRSEWFVAVNPKGKVPALETPDGILTENVAILSYLADRYPRSGLLPDDDRWRRAQALSLLCWCSSTLHPLVTMLRYPERTCDMAGAASRLREQARSKLAGQMQIAETQLRSESWIMGPQWCVADAYLSWCWGRCEEGGLAAADFPGLADHHRRMKLRPSAQAAFRHEARLLEAASA